MLFLKNYLESVENLRKHRLLKIQTYISSSRYIRIKISKRLDNSTESFPQKIKLSGMEMSGQALATLWMVVHSVQGIMFKDLKQISCTKCTTIHRVIVLQIAKFLAQADILVNFFVSITQDSESLIIH